MKFKKKSLHTAAPNAGRVDMIPHVMFGARCSSTNITYGILLCCFYILCYSVQHSECVHLPQTFLIITIPLIIDDLQTTTVPLSVSKLKKIFKKTCQ